MSYMRCPKPDLNPVLSIAVAAAVAVSAANCAAADDKDVPYVPTPHSTVKKMLEMADVGPNDIVYDLGAGDGRIVIAAVRDFDAKRGVGVDIDPERVREARENAGKAGVTDRVRFEKGNVFDFDFSEATVVTMFLLSSVNKKLRPRILNELEPGTRVVSHRFDMDDWEADNYARPDGRSIYFWVVPAQVQGQWRLKAGDQGYRLQLSQKFQKITGVLGSGEWRTRITKPELSGRKIRFNATAANRNIRFEGTVKGDGVIEGTMTTDGEATPVVARRVD